MTEKSVSLPRRLVAESIGTAFRLAAVVGSGIWRSVSPAATALALCAIRFRPAQFSGFNFHVRSNIPGRISIRR